MTLLIDITDFIKQVIISLACSSHLDFRNNCCTKRESRLFNLVKERNFQLDVSIHEVVLDLLKDAKFIEYRQRLENMHEEDEHEEDEKDELKYELFNYFIDYVGLYTVFTMHGDVIDSLKDMLFKI